ncbi:MAG: glycosyltransferase [Candidatus Rokubacteria bacterium]|nr:glycosyltransferase [Candidatus Rokubacteria bacterium]
MKVLYISYDGATDPLGRAQVLPYLGGLRREGFGFTLLSFEKPQALRMEGERVRGLLDAEGIRWVPLVYHKAPRVPATLYDMLAGVMAGSRLVRRHGIDMIHARSYIAAGIAYVLKRLHGVPFLFDMRGLWVDERVEGRLWPQDSVLYRTGKRWEQRLLGAADAVVILTERGRQAISGLDCLRGQAEKVTVIPTCVDLARFVADLPHPADQGMGCTFVYSGSLGTWYGLEEMLDFFLEARRRISAVRFLLLTSDPEYPVTSLLEPRGLRDGSVEVATAGYEDVPRWLAGADVLVYFTRMGYSRQACCPAKFGEALACGLPILTNEGIGDMDEIVEQEKVGYIVRGLQTEEYGRAALAVRDLLAEGPTLRWRCRDVARRYFSLEEGIRRYAGVYKGLAGRRGLR